ncbi:ATP-dependent DNA helicase Q5-like [Elgaria multicarinata webbii]|uniref:ATP-dependent DNA helicase Q5-like n=1 Tax=Elgaria multicarinata webbii TaxID=159646 RepID=UPI002FCCE9AC
MQFPTFSGLLFRYDEDGGSVTEANEDNQKKEWNNFYKKQMNLRKGKEPAKDNFVPPDADCPLKDAASRKIARITVKAREHCLKMLEEALSSNQQAVPEKDGPDPLTCAVEMEYEAFQTSKMANLYKATVLKKVAEINKASKDGELYSTLALGVQGSSKMKAEPTAPVEDEFFQASKVNTFKPKRVGIGFRKTSGVFQSASEILAAKEEDVVNPVKEISPNWKGDCSDDPEPVNIDNTLENTVKVTKDPEKKGQHSTSNAIASLEVSPTKKGKATKTQLLMAEAAKKESQNIVKFFSIPKAESKALAAECGVAEEESSYLSELPQFLHEEKAGSWETEIVSKEEIVSLSQIKEQGSEKTEGGLDLQSHSSGIKSSCSGSATGKPSNKSLVEDEMANSCGNHNGKRPGSAEDLESPGEKRLRMMAKSPISWQSDGDTGGLAKKKVTFDPNLSQVDKEGTTKSIQPTTKALSLKETADIVVKYLTPFYKSGKFASKDLFKGFARHLSHLLAADKTPLRKTVKEEAQRLIKIFFKTRGKCENEADWQELTSLET